MKKAAFALTTCVAMAAAPSALAQGEGDPPPSLGDEDSSCGCPCQCPGEGRGHAREGHRHRHRHAHGRRAGAMAQPSEAGAPSTPQVSTTTITSVPVPLAASPVHREPETITARERIRPHRPLLYTGLGMLSGAYVSTAALTATRVFQNPDKTMYIPVVGPWLHLKDIPEGMRDKVLIAGSGVVQGAGLALTVASFFIPEKISAATIMAGDMTLNVTPASFGPGSAGVGAVGQF